MNCSLCLPCPCFSLAQLCLVSLHLLWHQYSLTAQPCYGAAGKTVPWPPIFEGCPTLGLWYLSGILSSLVLHGGWARSGCENGGFATRRSHVRLASSCCFSLLQITSNCTNKGCNFFLESFPTAHITFTGKVVSTPLTTTEGGLTVREKKKQQKVRKRMDRLEMCLLLQSINMMRFWNILLKYEILQCAD